MQLRKAVTVPGPPSQPVLQNLRLGCALCTVIWMVRVCDLLSLSLSRLSNKKNGINLIMVQRVQQTCVKTIRMV